MSGVFHLEHGTALTPAEEVRVAMCISEVERACFLEAIPKHYPRVMTAYISTTPPPGLGYADSCIALHAPIPTPRTPRRKRWRWRRK